MFHAAKRSYFKKHNIKDEPGSISSISSSTFKEFIDNNVIHESIRGGGADDPHFHIFNSCLRYIGARRRDINEFLAWIARDPPYDVLKTLTNQGEKHYIDLCLMKFKERYNHVEFIDYLNHGFSLAIPTIDNIFIYLRYEGLYLEKLNYALYVCVLNNRVDMVRTLIEDYGVIDDNTRYRILQYLTVWLPNGIVFERYTIRDFM
jgi:hypothetical protein